MTPLLSIQKVSKHFSAGKQKVEAVTDFSLTIHKGEIVGLAGESGCGKTTLGKILVRLLSATSGQVFFNGLDIFNLSAQAMRDMRRQLQIVLQDPYGSLNPRLTVKEIVGEGLSIHKIAPGGLIEEALADVGLSSEFLDRHPHELSGGQRQRVSIARALVLKPEFIVFDESVSALDISHQRQIITLLKDLQKKHELTYLFISHDLSILKALADRIGIMYRGRLVELGAAGDIVGAPQHPYTQALVSAIPIPDPIKERSRQRLILAGDPPGPTEIILGCQFHPRCQHAQRVCREQAPAFDGTLACHQP